MAKFIDRRFSYGLFSLLFVVLFFSVFSKPAEALGVSAGGLNFLSCGNSKADTAGGRQCCTFPYFDVDLKIDGIPGVDLLTSFINDKIVQNIIPFPNQKKSTTYAMKWRWAYELQCWREGRPEYDDPANPDPYDGCTCVGGDSTEEHLAEELCRYVGNNDADPGKGQREKEACIQCISGKDRDGNDTGTGTGMWTGLGCVRTEYQAFIQENLLGWSIRIGGLIALLCIIYSSVRMQISRGNPEAIQKARERLTSCLLGLALIIFSILVLRVIGVNILGLPGFS